MAITELIGEHMEPIVPPDFPQVIPLTTDVPEGPWAVALRVCPEMLAGAEGNPVASPTCVADLAGALALGADGDTRERLLSLVGDAPVSAPRWDGVLQKSTSVWLDRKAVLSEDFLQACHDAEMKESTVDLSSQGDCKRIGDFVSRMTRGKLSLEVQPSADALACVVSALHLKDNWEDEFYEDATEDLPFTTEDGRSVEVPTMQGDRWSRVDGYGRCSVAGIGLRSGGAVLFALPERDVSLGDLVASGDATRAFYTYLHPEDPTYGEEVGFEIPKFKAETDYQSLEGALVGGVTADLSPMTGDAEALVRVVHGATIDLNENGVEGAAYTAAYAVAAGIPAPPRPFVLDRPFAYLVASREGEPLFMGLVRDPSE